VRAAKILLPLSVLVVGSVAFGMWLSVDGAVDLAQRVPGTDRPAGVQPAAEASGPALGRRSTGAAKPSTLPGNWPVFRGPDLDGVNRDGCTLISAFPESGPVELWSIVVGEGHAGAAIRSGCAYLFDYDRENLEDALRCLSLETGQEIWRYSYPVKIKRNHGMSRTVPALTDEYVLGIGPKCHVVCLKAASGELVWSLDLVKDFGTTEPPWYAGQCPIIEDGKAIIAPCGTDLMLALKVETGEIVWRTPNPRAWTMTHCSIVPMVLDGVRMYVYSASGGVYGVSATDGTILWDTDIWKVKIAAVATPVIIGDGLIFFSGGYNTGSMMARVKKTDTGYAIEQVFRHKAKVFGSEQQTPIFYEGFIYGVPPSGELVCMNLDGEIVWSSGHENRFGKGYEPWVIADGKIWVLNDQQVLTIAEATPEGYRPLASHKVLDGHDSWGPMAIAEGRMILRDLITVKCIDIGAR
jgi:outer membrane protein assembly factor BamB